MYIYGCGRKDSLNIKFVPISILYSVVKFTKITLPYPI